MSSIRIIPKYIEMKFSEMYSIELFVSIVSVLLVTLSLLVILLMCWLVIWSVYGPPATLLTTGLVQLDSGAPYDLYHMHITIMTYKVAVHLTLNCRHNCLAIASHSLIQKLKN